MNSTHWAGDIKQELGGSEHKPKKEISHIVTRKSANGGHIHEHHHTHPAHHPKEEHTTSGDDAMAEHMLQNMGTPNQGEAEADAGTPDAASATAAPSPDGSGAPAGGAAPAVPPGGPMQGSGA
jgi:hypothetical protein